MKRVVLFAIAFGVGSLAVVGQDRKEDAVEKLRARIVALEGELAARIQDREGRAGERVVKKTYNVGDLCGPVRDEIMGSNHLMPSGFPLLEAVEEEEPASPYEIDMIIELIRTVAVPESWDSIEGADMQPKGHTLLVHNVPSVHKEIGALLAQLRRYIAPQIAVNVTAIPVNKATAALLASRPRELTADEARALAEFKPLGSARVVCADGQQVVQRDGTQKSYIADYDVTIAEGAAMGAPQRASVFDGCAVQVRAMLDRRGNGAALHLTLERSKLGAPVRTVETEHGPLDLPVLHMTKVQTGLWAPLGKTVIVGGGGEGADACVFLITATKVVAK